MAQKSLNLKKADKKAHRVTKKQQNPRRNAPKQIKSKKPDSLGKLSKVYSLTASAEKLIASRVGHLEIIKGSRRQIEKAEKEAKAKKAAKAAKK